MVSQNARVLALIKDLKANPTILDYAKNIATSIVAGTANHCAATLSALLVFYDIYPNGGGTGSGDLEAWVPTLAYDLEFRRGWIKIPKKKEILPGDVGLVLASATVHHIYLVIDAKDQVNLEIADNQGGGMHTRPIEGDKSKHFSPTNYFLRAPDH